jgi:hypothetical protein
MKFLAVLAVLATAATPSVAKRTFTVYNNCPFTIWPAVCTSRICASAMSLTTPRVAVHGPERGIGGAVANNGLAAVRVRNGDILRPGQLDSRSYLGKPASWSFSRVVAYTVLC